MVEEIVRQTLSRAKKSGISVPESETTEPLPDPARDSLIQTLRSKHLDALAQQSQVSQSRHHRRRNISDTSDDTDEAIRGNSHPRHQRTPGGQQPQKRTRLSSPNRYRSPSPLRQLTPPPGSNSGEWGSSENEPDHHDEDNEFEFKEYKDHVPDRGPIIGSPGSSDLSDISDD